VIPAHILSPVQLFFTCKHRSNVLLVKNKEQRQDKRLIKKAKYLFYA
jgi:hypothetical protein